jgi:hypothetical protein
MSWTQLAPLSAAMLAGIVSEMAAARFGTSDPTKKIVSVVAIANPIRRIASSYPYSSAEDNIGETFRIAN